MTRPHHGESPLMEAVKRGFLSLIPGTWEHISHWRFIKCDDKGHYWFKRDGGQVWLRMPPAVSATANNIIPFPTQAQHRKEGHNE